MSINLALTISYDGTRYFGFQKVGQSPSIESTLTHYLEKILNHPIRLQAASRTDRGVHAKGQVINFFTSKHLNLDELKLSLRRLLPSDIQVLKIVSMPNDFHPSLWDVQKTYSYTFQTTPLSPFERHYIWFYPYDIDKKIFEENASQLIGSFNFKAFETTNRQPKQNTTCEIFSTNLTENNKRYRFEITGNRFLYKMVRTIVGTLVQISAGKLNGSIANILQSELRNNAGITAPPHALVLEDILYCP